jgi:hypothetical protein
MLKILLAPPDEFKAFLDQTSDALDTEELEVNFGHAKEFLGDNFIYALAPGSRLKYIQDKLAEKGVKDFNENGADSQRIATIMQVVYKLDMSIAEPSAVMFMLGPFELKLMAKMGLIEETPDGCLKLPESTSEDDIFGDMPLEERAKIEAQVKEVMIEDYGDREKGEIKDNANANFESRNFGLPGHLPLPKAMQPGIEILRQKYIKKFGRPEKLGKYICPIDKPIIDFCSSIIERETGKKVPGTKFLIDYNQNSPYTSGNDVVIPSMALADNSLLVQSITSEIPHLIVPHEDLTIDYFKKDRLSFFRRNAWSEGVPMRLQEKVLEEYIAAVGSDFSAEIGIISTVNQGVMLERSMHPAFIKVSGLETMMNYTVYYDMSYMYGWHFVRQLDGKQFRMHLNYEKPWESKKLGWNRKSLEPKDRTAIEGFYNQIRKVTEDKYKSSLKEKEYNLLTKAFDKWKADFLPSQKA